MCNSVIDTFDYIVKYIPKHQNPNQTQSKRSSQNEKSNNRNSWTSWNDTPRRYFGMIPRKAPAMDIAIPMD